MAGVTVTGKRTDHAAAANEKLRQEFNRLVDDVEALRAALVAHGGAAHAAVNLPAANLTGAKVNAP
jgi:hypothetical protein